MPPTCQAEKRRETLVVGLSKTKDQLSVAEEKYKSLQLDMQRTQMDLLAKTSEGGCGCGCVSLEKKGVSRAAKLVACIHTVTTAFEHGSDASKFPCMCCRRRVYDP